MCIEQLRLKIAFPEFCLGKLKVVNGERQVDYGKRMVTPCWVRYHYMLLQQQGIRRICHEQAVE